MKINIFFQFMKIKELCHDYYDFWKLRFMTEFIIKIYKR